MGRTCSVKNCPKTEGIRLSDTSFFKFPDEAFICEQWLEFCGSDELTATYKASGSYGIRGRKVCSDHFARDSFRLPDQKFRGLKYGAIPCLKGNDDEYVAVEYLKDKRPESENVEKSSVATDGATAMNKVEKRYYVQGRYDLFEVLILASPEDSESSTGCNETS